MKVLGAWLALAEVVKHLVCGVVAGDEGDAGAAVTAGAAEVEPVDADRQVAESPGPGSVRVHQVRVQQPEAEVACGGAEHSVHVVGREGDVMCRI